MPDTGTAEPVSSRKLGGGTEQVLRQGTELPESLRSYKLLVSSRITAQGAPAGAGLRGGAERGAGPGRGRGAGPEAAQFLLPTPHPPRCRHLALRGAEGAGKCSPWPGRGARPSGALLPVSCSAPLCWVSELCRAGSRGSERAGRLPSVAQPVVARTQICSSRSLVRPELCPDAFFSFKPSRRRFILLKKKMETDVTEGAINFG